MSLNRLFRLIFTLIFFIGCVDTIEKVEFQESDKNKIIFPQDILSEDYLNSIELKDHSYKKGIEIDSSETYYKYNCNFWENDTYIGGFVSSTYEHPFSDSNEMEGYFSAYNMGNRFKITTSSKVRSERTYDFNLPFETYRVYKVYKSDTLNIGLIFNILKDNKIIHNSIITKDKFELDLNKFVEKLDKL